MADLNPKRVYLNGSSPWLRHTITVVPLLILGAVAFTQVQSNAEDALEQAAENEAEIDAIKEALGSIRTNQAVIKIEQRNESEKNEQFREETGRDLERILEKLDNAQPSGGR